MSEQPKCKLCGEPMPEGEEMFITHGFSGPCPAKPRPAHQLRVVSEKEELDSRIESLSLFLATAIYSTLDQDEKGRLYRQLNVMKEYSEILGARIEAFDK